jgi:hypothetical protein
VSGVTSHRTHSQCHISLCCSQRYWFDAAHGGGRHKRRRHCRADSGASVWCASWRHSLTAPAGWCRQELAMRKRPHSARSLQRERRLVEYDDVRESDSAAVGQRRRNSPHRSAASQVCTLQAAASAARHCNRQSSHAGRRRHGGRLGGSRRRCVTT